MTPLATKLKIKEHLPLWILGADEQLYPLFKGYTIKEKLLAKDFPEQLLLFVKQKKDLDAAFPKIIKLLPKDALFWIGYPKKSGGVSSDLIRDEGWEIVQKTGWEGVASVSIDDTWSGIRFKYRDTIKTMKRSVPMQDRKTEGIDYVNRTVQLPQDALAAMMPYKGLEAFFNKLSFTHKKEYAEAIAGAKKPETRARRIDKMIEMVLRLKTDKENKDN